MSRLIVLSLVLAGCGGGGAAAPLVVPARSTSADMLDETILHYVDLEVAPEFVPALVPFSDEWVPARIVYDDVELADVGLKLKGHSSAQGLDGKPGFSLKTNQFVKGQKLRGIKRFTLNNAVQDPSFLCEHLGYEVFRRAGVCAHRTAFARVTLNGTFYGVYVVADAYDGDYLKAHFADDGGNLYEGAAGVDVTDVDAMELHTNEDVNDRSDLGALRDALLGAGDAEIEAALGPLVDLDEFFVYWAVEAIACHWDGYSGMNTAVDDVYLPNNYYVYEDPSTGRFVFMAHGADQLFGSVWASVLSPPTPSATVAHRLFSLPSGHDRYLDAVRAVLDSAWDEAALLARIDRADALIRGSVAEEDGRRHGTYFDFRGGLLRVRDFVRSRRAMVNSQLRDEGR